MSGDRILRLPLFVFCRNVLAGSSYEYFATQKPGIDRGKLLQPMPSRLADNV